jgi:hypothetical protein
MPGSLILRLDILRAFLEALVIKLSTLGGIALAGLSGLAVLPGLAIGQAAAPVSVIELYTSQGCSSCPPADRLLQVLSQRPEIIALSFPVTYWDYLGWKDTLASPENVERQRGYAAAQGDGQVFTPELVVNGLKVCVGSDLDAIESALKSTSGMIRKDAVPLTVKRESGQLVIEAGAAPQDSSMKKGKVWIASVQRSSAVQIKRGENAGRLVTYTNVVRQLTSAGEWQGAPASYAIPAGALPKGGDMYVVFLQAETLGPIVAAARVEG